MRRRLMWTVLLCLAAVAVLATVAVPVQAQRNVNPRVFPPQAKPFGLSYGDWGARYWQWLALIPTAENPLSDPTGARAGDGQSGKVWFLTATDVFVDIENGVLGKVSRTITIPHGKAVFIPIWSGVSCMPWDGSTEAELRAGWVAWSAHVTKLEVSVDGRQLRNLFSYWFQSSLFRLWWTPDNVVWRDPADTPPADAIAAGFYVMLTPLPAGHHVIHWENVDQWTQEADGEDFTGIRDITYHITVTPR